LRNASQEGFGSSRVVAAAARLGGNYAAAKAWKGEGPGVFEFVDRFDGGGRRAMWLSARVAGRAAMIRRRTSARKTVTTNSTSPNQAPRLQ
jgi:hypothetical protein